jgi:hemoglobin/transferrin/lactoferrin receptor protein
MNLALYLQDELTLWERIFLIPALRWDRFENDPVGQKRVTDSKVSPKIGVVLKVTDFLYVETNYGEGFRAPNFGELFIAGTHFPGAVFVPNPDLKPEKSKNIDVGIRIRSDHLLFAQDRFLIRGAYFRNSLDDFIDFDVRFNPAIRQLVFRPVNIQDALIQGYEAEMQWDFYPGFEFLANYTETRGDDQTKHRPLATIPPRKGVVGLSYLYAPWALTVGGRMQIVDDQNRVPQGTSRTGGYTVYDL